MSCTQRTCSRKEIKNWMKMNALLILTTAGVVLGVALGIAMREANLSKLNIKYFAFPGEIFLQMLTMLIPLLIVCSLITGVSSMEGKSSRRLGLRTFTYFISTTFIAAVLGIILVISINPGQYGTGKVKTKVQSLQVEPVDSILDLIRNAFPDNIVEATFQRVASSRVLIMTENDTQYNISNTTNDHALNSTIQSVNITEDGDDLPQYTLLVQKKSGMNVLGLIVFCTTFGVIIGSMGKEGKILVDFFATANEVVMKMVYIVTWYSPCGIMFLIASKIMDMDEPNEVVAQLGLYLIAILIGSLIHSFIFLPIAYLVLVRKNPFKYMMGVMQALLACLATASGSATLPITIKCSEDKNGIDKRISRLVLPLGTTMNMDGSAIYVTITTVFIAQENGVYLDAGQIVVVCLTSVFANIGAGVPQAALVTLIIVMSAVGLPVDLIALVLAADWLLDRVRTFVNVWSTCIGAGIIEKLSKRDLEEQDVEQGIKAPTERQSNETSKNDASNILMNESFQDAVV